jgi:class 3 adenylate cyclase
MAEERLQRRLAAILSADVVGYSRLMGMDEAGTLSRLNALRRELIDPTIAAHSGRIVKLMGDGALVEFASAVDAVTCAIEVQRQLREHDAGSTKSTPIQFRIGSTSVTSSSKAKTSSVMASTSRRGSKVSPNPVVSRSPRTPGDRCKVRSRPTSSMPASRASRILRGPCASIALKSMENLALI